MSVSTHPLSPGSDNPDEAEGVMGGFPRGQHAFKSPSPIPKRWGFHPRFSILGLAHPIFSKSPRPPIFLSLERSCVPEDTLARSRSNPRPFGWEPRCFPSPHSAAAAAPLQHPSPPFLPSSRRKSLCFLCSHRQPSLGTQCFLGGVFLYTLCVCARECVSAKCSTHPSA